MPARPRDQRKGQHIGRHHRQRADHRAPADADELVHARKPADDDLVAQMAMPRDGDVVDEDHAVADPAVMGDVAAGHEETVVALLRQPAAAGGTGVHGDVFADAVAGADHQPRVLARVFQVLRRLANAGEGIEGRAGADLGVAHDDDMGLEHHPVAQPHAGADVAEGADADALAQGCPRLDDGRGVDERLSHPPRPSRRT